MVRRILILSASLAVLASLLPSHGSPVVILSKAKLAVVALIDTGINPYSPAFRDDSSLATWHPSFYIDGYPHDAKPLNLSLDEPTLEAALEKDARVWARVVPRQLYYIPGTSIVGAISMGAGGRSCPRDVGGQPVTFPPPAGLLNVGSACPERLILDDAGHGTSTASRVVGKPASLGKGNRIVMIEGLGTASSMWAAEQPWIDVQSNSWGFLTGVEPGAMRAFRSIADEQLVVAASGNGTGFSGFAPSPTYAHALAAPGVIVVGGHDNGRVTAWSGAPASVVADAFAPMTAFHDSLAVMAPHPVACCTSTATPYVAGAAAAMIRRARILLDSHQNGIHEGVVARGRPGLVSDGPLADGVFTLGELRTLLLRTAEARPRKGRHDGALHFAGGPSEPRWVDENGTGENPYCQGCWTLPLRWREVPAGVPAYASIGYGAVNERSLRLARRVLNGRVPLPARPEEDAFFEQDRALRQAVWSAV